MYTPPQSVPTLMAVYSRCEAASQSLNSEDDEFQDVGCMAPSSYMAIAIRTVSEEKQLPRTLPQSPIPEDKVDLPIIEPNVEQDFQSSIQDAMVSTAGIFNEIRKRLISAVDNMTWLSNYTRNSFPLTINTGSLSSKDFSPEIF